MGLAPFFSSAPLPPTVDEVTSYEEIFGHPFDEPAAAVYRHLPDGRQVFENTPYRQSSRNCPSRTLDEYGLELCHSKDAPGAQGG